MTESLSTDLVSQLRQMEAAGYAGWSLARDAADEIERLVREIAEVRAELATHEPWRADDVPAAPREELGGWRCDHCQEWNRWGPNDGVCTRCSVTRGCFDGK